MAFIDRTAIVSPMARLGSGVVIGPYAVICGGVTLHDDVHVRAHAVIGSPGEKSGYFNAAGLGVTIGRGTHVSEHVTIHSGIIRKTSIGEDCLLLTKSHIGHDVCVGNKATISCSVLVGGESQIDDGANLGLGSIIHQRSWVGSWSFVGAGAVVTKNRRILPGNIYVGNPAKFLKANAVGLERAGISDERINNLRMSYISTTPEWTHK